MSKNLFRKGLATGAIVALSAAALSAAPAFAAGEINVAPSLGTSYNIPVTDTFNLLTTFAPGYTPSSYSQLKYAVTTDGVASIDALAGTSAQAPATTTNLLSTTSANSYTAVLTATSASAVTQNYLGLKVDGSTTASTTSTTVSVTAFVDANNDGAVSAGEWATTKTVTFKKYSEIVPTLTLTQPAAGDVTAKATVSYGDLNTQELTATDFKVVFTGATGVTAGGVTATSGVYTQSGLTALTTETVSAQASYKGTLMGSAVSATTTARSITALATTGATLTASADAKTISSTNYARTNKAFTVAQLVKDTASTPAVAAGVAVTATVTTSATVSTSKYLTINGQNLTTSALVSAFSASLTSDASGLASLTVTPVGYAAGDTVTVTFASQNYTNSIVVTEASASYSIATTDVLGSSSRKAAHGATTVINYSVTDQFGQAISGTYRLNATVSGTGFSNFNVYTPVTAGAAAQSITDPSTSTGATTTVANLLEVQGTDGNWSSATATKTVTINNSSAAGAYYSAGTTPAATYTGTVSTDSAYTAGGNAPVSISVQAAVAGSSVTLAGTGLGFELNSKIYTDSVSFLDNGSAQTVKVYSFTSGAQTVTTTVDGVASKSSVITYAAAAPANVAITLPANAQAGQAMDVVFSVTDVHGNAAAAVTTSGSNDGHLVISATGAGYLSTTGAVATGSKGTYTAKLITGAADLGTTYINATIDLATDVTVAKSIEFGLTDADVVSGGHRVFVDYSFAKGKTLTITIDGKRAYSQVVASDVAGELAFTQKKKGAHTVTVRISGGIVFTEKVSTN